MTIRNFANTQAIKTGVVFGFASGIIFLIMGRFTLDDSAKYTGNLLTTVLTFAIICSGIILCFISLIKDGKTGNLTIKQIALAGLFFSLVAGLAGGFYHYINAVFIHPDYTEKALEAAKANWSARHYAKEAIAGQVELTGIFQTPMKWAVVSGLFLSTCILILSILLGGLFKIITRNRLKSYSA